MDTYDARDDRPLDDTEQDDFDAAMDEAHPNAQHRMLDADEIYWIFRADPNPQ